MLTPKAMPKTGFVAACPNMAKANYFEAGTECPHCHFASPMSFEADIGVLEYNVYHVGDLVITRVPLLPKRGRYPKPIGPDLGVDWERPFWAVGISRCPVCRRDVFARVEIHDRRFFAVRPTPEPIDLFAWGPIADPLDKK